MSTIQELANLFQGGQLTIRFDPSTHRFHAREIRPDFSMAMFMRRNLLPEELMQILNPALQAYTATHSPRPEPWPLIECEVDGVTWFLWNPYKRAIEPAEDYRDILRRYHGNVTEETVMYVIFQDELLDHADTHQAEIRAAIERVYPDVFVDCDEARDPSNWVCNKIAWYSFPNGV